MTCIVAARDTRRGRVVVGANSCANSCGDMESLVCAQPKVFRVGRFVIGYTSSFRMGQLLQHIETT